MKIMIAGLGLIGGSMAKSLARAGYSADGFDRAPVLRRAEEEGVVARAAADTRDYDVVFVALPPDAAMEYIGGHPFREGAVNSYIRSRAPSATSGVTRWRGRRFRDWKIPMRPCSTARA